jgi:hypothetical protein
MAPAGALEDGTRQVVGQNTDLDSGSRTPFLNTEQE